MLSKREPQFARVITSDQAKNPVVKGCIVTTNWNIVKDDDQVLKVKSL